MSIPQKQSPSPISIAASLAGLRTSQDVDAQAVTSAALSAVSEVSEMAKAKAGTQILRDLLEPKVPDPVQQLSALTKVVADTAGLASIQDEREARREERVQKQELEAQRLELVRAEKEAARENASTQLVLALMKQQQDMMAQFNAALQQRDKEMRELLLDRGKRSEEPRKDPLSDIAVALLKDKVEEVKQGPPSLSQQLEHYKGVAELLGLSRPPANDLAAQVELKKWEQQFQLSLEDKKYEREMSVEEAKTQRTQALIQHIGPALTALAAAFSGRVPPPVSAEQATGAAAQGPSEPPQGPPQYRYTCLHPDCGQVFLLDEYTTTPTCPHCHYTMNYLEQGATS